MTSSLFATTRRGASFGKLNRDGSVSGFAETWANGHADIEVKTSGNFGQLSPDARLQNAGHWAGLWLPNLWR
jgi:hypothetical protein